MTFVFQAVGIVLFVGLMFIAFVVCVVIAADRFWKGVDQRKLEVLAADVREAEVEVERIKRSHALPNPYAAKPAPPPAWPAVWLEPEEDDPVYLRKWTAGRKLDARREQEQWDKLFDSSLR